LFVGVCFRAGRGRSKLFVNHATTVKEWMVTARRVLGEGGPGALTPRPKWHDVVVFFEDTRSCHVLRANVEALLDWDPQAGAPPLPPDLQWVRLFVYCVFFFFCLPVVCDRG
jgi:hypothetical protein